MKNKDIIKVLEKTAQLMELTGENDFKIRSYQNAAFTLERLDVALETLSIEELEKLDGVGKTIAKAIYEINESGTLELLEKLQKEVPPGVEEMLKLKGAGPKKIKALWQELHITSLEELLQAIEDNKVAELKGFGKKTQENLLASANYLLENRNKWHYSKAEAAANTLLEALQGQLPKASFSTTGLLRRKWEIIEELPLLCGSEDLVGSYQKLEKWEGWRIAPEKCGPYHLRGTYGEEEFPFTLRFCDSRDYANTLLKLTGSARHLALETPSGDSLYKRLLDETFTSEEEAYRAVKWPYIVPELREGLIENEIIKDQQEIRLLEVEDLKGILHNHSTYSDGKNTLEEMVQYCKDLGYEYLGMADHSKSAQYANGLYENRVKQQQEEIDELNEKLKPFHIFKGIESDILGDGSLDYAPETLGTFDYIVASIHSGLQMDQAKATQRLITAIENPFTTMLGHPTGRLLLQREGYPIDHKAIIDACAQHNVIIEINANPWRLDIDWRWVHYALEQNVMISINPDAHATEGYHDMYYGVCVGRKGGLTPEMTFNAQPLDFVKKHFEEKRQKALATIA